MLEEQSGDLRKDARAAWRYLLSVMAAVVIVGAAVVFWGLYGLDGLNRRDHFGQIDLEGDRRWYMNFANLVTREMQDRDLLFHGIGTSVENLKKADIIMLGNAGLEFGIDNEQIEAFEQKHRVRIYNLSNPGIASGEYIRSLIKKWHLQPKIWIINADDDPGEFFNDQMDDFFPSGRNSAFAIRDASYFTSYVNVAARGIRWRLEQWVADYGPAWLTKPPYSFSRDTAKSWRNVENGNFNLEKASGYLSPGPVMGKRRGGTCPVSVDTMKKAGRYIADIGGSVIITLLPYDGWCPDRISELASGLGVESFMPPDGNYQSLDGRHMNQTAALAYTKFMLAALEKTYAFKTLIGDPNPGTPPAAPLARMSLPIELCVANEGKSRLFVSLRSERGTMDHAIEAGAVLRVPGLTDGQLCSSTESFNRGQCPNERYQAAAICK